MKNSEIKYGIMTEEDVIGKIKSRFTDEFRSHYAT